MAKTPRSPKEARNKLVNNRAKSFSITEKYFIDNEKPKREGLRSLAEPIKGEK